MTGVELRRLCRNLNTYLEDGLPVDGSVVRNSRAIWMGVPPPRSLWGRKRSMLINHLHPWTRRGSPCSKQKKSRWAPGWRGCKCKKYTQMRWRYGWFYLDDRLKMATWTNKKCYQIFLCHGASGILLNLLSPYVGCGRKTHETTFKISE